MSAVEIAHLHQLVTAMHAQAIADGEHAVAFPLRLAALHLEDAETMAAIAAEEHAA